ncbi:MAG: hypothetical protein AAF939_16395, partial [Planctomycetota bacterium]
DDLPVLIELLDNKNWLGQFPDDSYIVIDHHGTRSGHDQPTSIEQLFDLLKLPPQRWTRHFDLVAANDRAHIDGMLEIEATPQELKQIRQLDRQAQGITDEQERQGQLAASKANRITTCYGELCLVNLPHNRTATVTDHLNSALGGVCVGNLLIHSPEEITFFGDGQWVQKLADWFPKCWFGGDLPDKGFWGTKADPKKQIEIQNRLVAAMNQKQAKDITVDAFHHTLIWPMLMRGPRDESTIDGPIDRFVDALSASGWSEVGVGSSKVDSDYTYEEVVYFHPFVRDFLFGDGQQDHTERARRRFVRSDLNQLHVEVKSGSDQIPDVNVRLRVERTEIFLIRPRIAVVMIELSNRVPNEAADSSGSDQPKLDDARTKLSLADVQFLQSKLRTIYPPYFDHNDQHGNCASIFEWGGISSPSNRHTQTHADDFREFTQAGGEPPIFSHWQSLFDRPDGTHAIEPLQSAKDLESGKLYFQQLIDDRMPGMSFITVKDPDEIQQEDEDQLPGFDVPGFSYAQETRDKERSQFTYRRFRHKKTTYYCNGVSFALVCGTKERFSTLLIDHFRRHYTHLAVIAQYQHAALLYFFDQLAIVSRQMGLEDCDAENTPTGWQARLTKLQQRFLKFKTRSFFTEVSNQIQPKELFALWYQNLGTGDLFERASATSRELYEVVENREVKRLSNAQMALSTVATWGLAVSIFLSFMALGLSLFESWAGSTAADGKGMVAFGFAVVISFLLSALPAFGFIWYARKHLNIH